MTTAEGLESWNIHVSVEVEDEEEADGIFSAIQDCLEKLGHTQWTSKMYRDLNMEKALEVFRKNKEEILASLPREVVEQYYPDRVAIGDDVMLGEEIDRHLSVVPELEEE